MKKPEHEVDDQRIAEALVAIGCAEQLLEQLKRLISEIERDLKWEPTDKSTETACLVRADLRHCQCWYDGEGQCCACTEPLPHI